MNPMLLNSSESSLDQQIILNLTSENSNLSINNSKNEISNSTNINQSLQMEDLNVGLTQQQAITSKVPITNIPTDIVTKLPVQNYSTLLNSHDSLDPHITTNLPMEDLNLINKLTASTVDFQQRQNIADIQPTTQLTHSTSIDIDTEITTSLPSENSNFFIYNPSKNKNLNKILQIDDSPVSVVQPITTNLTKDNENILQSQDLVLLNLPELLTTEISTIEKSTINLSYGKLNVENQEQFSLDSRGSLDTEIGINEVQQSMKPLDANASVSNENSTVSLNQDLLELDTHVLLPIDITTSSPIHLDPNFQNEIVNLLYTTENSNIVTIATENPVDVTTNLQNLNQNNLEDVQPFSVRLSLPSGDIISNGIHNVNDLTFPKQEKVIPKLPSKYSYD